MQWIHYCLIMYIASVFQYLLVRKIQKDKVDNRLNTFMFLTPAIPFIFLLAILNHTSLFLSINQLLMITAATYIFSYLGNLYSFLGIQYAPNVGYSLIIQKSYAIYTSIAAVLIFGSKISLIGLMGILVVVLFTGIILLEKNVSTLHLEGKWTYYSLLSFFMFGNLALFSKYIQLQGINPITVSLYIFLFNGIFNGVNVYRHKKSINFHLPKDTWLFLILIGLSNGVFNLMMQLAYKSAPNIGYVNIMNTASITAITLLSAYFFKDKLTIEKIIGVVGVVVGIIILVLS